MPDIDRDEIIMSLTEIAEQPTTDGIVDGIDQQTIRGALALLKEQEPTQVIQRKAMHMLFWCCGSCGVAITEGDKFCRMCGKAVKWE